jgi:hypothetical protein
MPQICDMGETALLPLRRKACCGFFRRLRYGLGTRVQHANHYTTEAATKLLTLDDRPVAPALSLPSVSTWLSLWHKPKRETDSLHKPHRPNAETTRQNTLQFVLYQSVPTVLLPRFVTACGLCLSQETETQPTGLLFTCLHWTQRTESHASFNDRVCSEKFVVEPMSQSVLTQT